MMNSKGDPTDIFSVLAPILNPLLHSLLLARAQPQTLAIPDQQMETLGKLFNDMQFRNPANMAEIQGEAVEPYGRLGRMLTEEERKRLLQLLTRRDNPYE